MAAFLASSCLIVSNTLVEGLGGTNASSILSRKALSKMVVVVVVAIVVGVVVEGGRD